MEAFTVLIKAIFGTKKYSFRRFHESVSQFTPDVLMT